METNDSKIPQFKKSDKNNEKRILRYNLDEFRTTTVRSVYIQGIWIITHLTTG